MPRSSQPNRSLINGLDVLEAALAADAPVGTRELARELALDRSVVNRLLLTLADQGMLERTDDGRYRPAHGVHVLAGLSLRSSGLVRAALPAAASWTARGFAFTLGVLWRHHLCHLLHARPGQPVEEAVAGKATGDAFASAAGLALLAHAPAAVCRAALAGRSDAADCAAALAAARERGHAVRRFADGAIAVGVAFGRPARTAIAVSRAGLAEPEIAVCAAELAACAAALSSPVVAGGPVHRR